MIAAAVRPAVLMTTVDLLWIEGQIERWLRFGRDAGDQIIDRRRRIVSFRPGSIFALLLAELLADAAAALGAGGGVAGADWLPAGGTGWIGTGVGSRDAARCASLCR